MNDYINNPPTDVIGSTEPLQEEWKFTAQPQATLEWWFSENMRYCVIVKKTWYNRWKWWIATKLFLPGTHKWLKP